jgi:hypothetical protein
MASDGAPGKIPVVSLLQGSQAASSVGIQAGGKSLPPGGKTASSAATATAAATVTATAAATSAKAASGGAKASLDDAQALANVLNKHLNDSGRATQFRVDPDSGNKMIQEVNPANGEVVGEFPVTEFPALARSIGAAGLLIDDLV